jgi:hypothetical protein
MAQEFKAKLNPFTGTLQLVPTNVVLEFKAAVATQTSLPLVSNEKGDARIASDTGILWVWSLESATGLLTDWVSAGDIVDTDWSVITNKPSSSVADIDSAVSLKHAQNTDQYLDFGGASQASAADVADAVSKRHTQNTDTKLDLGGANEIAVTEIAKKSLASVTYYINCDTGSDSNPGTNLLPFQTITKAVSLIPDVLIDKQYLIYLQDSLNYNESISIRGKTGGRIQILSVSADNTKVLIQKNTNICILYDNTTPVIISNISLRVTANNIYCINVNQGAAIILSCAFGDNGNTGTYGIYAFGVSSEVVVKNGIDYDSNKVAIGIYSYRSKIFSNANVFGDVQHSSLESGYIIIDNPIISKTDYDDAVAHKDLTGNPHDAQASEIDTTDSGLTVQDKIDNLDVDTHSHSNKTVLDQIQEALTTLLKASYDSAVTDSHTHSNKATLDAIEQALTTALKSAYDDAVSKAHTQNTDYILVLNSSGLPALINDGELKENLLVTALKTIDGRDLSVDGLKLDGVEAGAVALATVKADGDIASAIADDHTHSNKATLDAIEEAFTSTLKTKLDNIINPMLYKGGITLAADFPTLALVQSGWTYTVLADVTDNDVTKTNTGQTFLSNAEIAWNGSNWTSLGYSAVKSVAGKTGIVTLDSGDVGLGNVDNKSEATIITDVKADSDVADAISKKHTQGTDQSLDTGGANEVSAANAKAAYTHSGVVTGNPHSVTKTEVGLGNVDDTSDATKNSATVTLTNKRINPRVTSTASSATPTPNIANEDLFILTALAEAASFDVPTGTPTQGQKLVIRIKDNASARALAWNAIYRASSDLALPTTTIISKTMYLGFIYNDTDSKWDLIAFLDNF